MSQRTTLHALLATAAATLAVATGGCGDQATEAADGGYPLQGVCIYDAGGRELCGKDGAKWCESYIAERDKVRVDEFDVDVLEIGCEAYEG